VSQLTASKPPNLVWQSKAVLLLVVPYAGTGLVLQVHWWGTQAPQVAIWTLGLSLLLALVVLKLRAATPGGGCIPAGLVSY